MYLLLVDASNLLEWIVTHRNEPGMDGNAEERTGIDLVSPNEPLKCVF